MSLNELEKNLRRIARKKGAGITIKKTIRGPNRAVPRNPLAPKRDPRGTPRGFGRIVQQERKRKRGLIG